MKIIRFSEKINEPLCLALGYFDTIHAGHRALLNAVIDYAKICKSKSAVFTFSNNYFQTLGKQTKLVYSIETRLSLFEELGIDYVILADFDKCFMNIDYSEFLKMLSDYNLKMLASGKDYKFGHLGKGDVNNLLEYFFDKNVNIYLEDDFKIQGKMVSSTLIRQVIVSNRLSTLESVLGSPYRISCPRNSCEIFNENKMKISSDILQLKNGIYKAKLFDKKNTAVSRVRYECSTNNIILEFLDCKCFYGIVEFDFSTEVDI